MMRFRWLMVFLLAACAAPLRGQTPAAAAPLPSNTASKAQESTDERIKVRVDLVNVLFTVTDKKNRMVLDLTKDDFRVAEGDQPQQIRFFSRETNLPLRIGILLDTSNSIRERLHFEQEAAIDFLDSTLRPGKDQAYVLAFDVTPQLVQDYTDDTNKLADAIRGLQAGGGTGLYDAIYYACKEKMIYFPPPEPYLRRALVVLSDGLDNQSEHTRDEALSMAERAEATIYAISTNRMGPQSRGDRVLDYLAKQTGGRAFFPFASAATDSGYQSYLAANFQDIGRELRSQYSLAYISTNPAHDGSFRRITIEPREKNLHVRAKEGYFAPSQ